MKLSRSKKIGIVLALATMVLVFIAVAALALTLLLADDDETVEAGGMWFAWLYHPEGDRFMRVYEDGTTEEYSLNLPPGERMASSPRAFAPGGEMIAFCTFNESTSTRNLYVHSFNPDAAAKAGLSFPEVFDMSQHIECSVSDGAFNQTDSSRIAVGVVNHFPGDPNADTTRPQWELLVFDITTGTLAANYDANTPGADQLSPFEGGDRYVVMPLVHSFEGDQVFFELVPWGTEYLPGQNVVAWQVGTQTVTPAQGPQGQIGFQTNPATGEKVWLAIDESLPQAEPLGPMPTYNVVLYQHPSMAEPYAVFHQPDTIVTQVKFVEGGHSLMVQSVPGFDPNDPPQGPESTWTLLQRSGGTTPLALNAYVYSVAGLHDGFATWESNYETWTATLTRYTLGDDPANPAVSPIWQGDDPNWSMVWSFPQPTGGDADLFPPIAR